MAAMNWVTHVGRPAFAPAAHELLAYPNPARDHVDCRPDVGAREWVLCNQSGGRAWFQVGLAELPMGVFIRTTEPNGHQRTVRI